MVLDMMLTLHQHLPGLMENYQRNPDPVRMLHLEGETKLIGVLLLIATVILDWELYENFGSVWQGQDCQFVHD